MGWHWGVLASSGGGAAGAYELISTTVLSTATASVSFSSIPSTYKHLQIRVAARADNSAEYGALYLRCNGVSTASYSYHELYGTGSGVTSTGNSASTDYPIGWNAGANAPTGTFSSSVVDILDYASTTKNKTMRTLNGMRSSSWYRVYLTSGLFINTSALSSISITGNGNFVTGSRFSLYGVKG